MRCAGGADADCGELVACVGAYGDGLSRVVQLYAALEALREEKLTEAQRIADRSAFGILEAGGRVWSLLPTLVPCCLAHL